jgi:hypothetical protein
MDALAAFRDAAARLDADAAVTALSADVEFRAPLHARLVFRGREELHALFTALFGTFDRVEYVDTYTGGSGSVVVVDGWFGPFSLTDALLVEVDGTGAIRRLRPHLRPLGPSVVFVLLVVAKLLARPAMLARVMRRAASAPSR